MSGEKNQSYQEAMDQLEQILERIDNTDVGIDELAGQVQKAADLLKTCRRILTETEKSVQAAIVSLDPESPENPA
ncbi:MAG TPA: exodeoxyribonuclease VII small subunit [Fibrobacteraceae bacterium]|nr:exodeoxyribonuclease VII small subunit [Fibrobacteraceae bacterium]